MRIVPPGVLAGVGSLAGLTGSALAAEARSPGGAKVIFVLFKRPDMTPEESLADWIGERHTTIVRTIPGLRKWVQNVVVSEAAETTPIGIGELWFANAEMMEHAMKSTEMGAAFEDAKSFLDMEKTFSIVVEEKTVIG